MMVSVPRTVRRTISAFTRVFDALWWRADEPGPMLTQTWIPALRRTAEEALHRVRDTRKLSA